MSGPLEQAKGQTQSGPVLCHHCGKACKGEVLRVQNKHFHIKCFVCRVCGCDLAQGGFFVRQGEYICTLDYQRLYGTRCFSCEQFIEGEVVSALGKTYHPQCFVCAVCKQPFPAGDRVTFNGRECICQKCTQPLPDNSPAPVQAVHNCCGCGKEFQNEQSLVALEKHWHLGCFKCKVCNKVLNAEYISKDGIPYCEMDYHAMYGIQCENCKQYITGKVLEAGEKHYHPTCARCVRCDQMFGEGEEMYLQGSSIWHPPCRQAARLEEKTKKQVRIQLTDLRLNVPEQVTRASSESITSAHASSASGSPSRVFYAKLGDEYLDYKDLAALPKIKAIYNIDRPDMLSYSQCGSYPPEEKTYAESPQLLTPTPTEGDGEKSPHQRRASSPSSNSSLGGYGRYTPSRSPQTYSRPEHVSSRYTPQPGNSSSLPVYSAGRYDGRCSPRESHSLAQYHSSGRTPSHAGSGGVALQLNPTTLALLQQHNYIPYFQGIETEFKQEAVSESKPRTGLHLSLSPYGSESGRSTPSLSAYSDGKSPSSTYVSAPKHFHIPDTKAKDNIYRKPPIYKQHASRGSWQDGDDLDRKTRTSWTNLKSEMDGQSPSVDPRTSTHSLPTDMTQPNFSCNKSASLPGYGRNGIYKGGDLGEDDHESEWGAMRGQILCIYVLLVQSVKFMLCNMLGDCAERGADLHVCVMCVCVLLRLYMFTPHNAS
ncbi:actin-binding LIM protein 2 isoform X4 [Brachyhypopomus gauderio]